MTSPDAISKLEDQELEFMEQGDQVAREVATATRTAQEATKVVEGQVASINEREQRLRAELEQLESNRGELASAVDDSIRARYERLLKSKGESVVVCIQHGCCGGCHMRLPAQVMITCQSSQEIVNCPNCGRILYYTRDMNLVAAE